MSTELLNSFDVLDINTKRNEISKELMLIHSLIKKYEIDRGVTPITTVKNYNENTDNELTEAEALTFFYEDIYNIEQELISLLKAIDMKGN